MLISNIYIQYEEVADKDDLMGVEDTAKRGLIFLEIFILLKKRMVP